MSRQSLPRERCGAAEKIQKNTDTIVLITPHTIAWHRALWGVVLHRYFELRCLGSEQGVVWVEWHLSCIDTPMIHTTNTVNIILQSTGNQCLSKK